MGNIRQTERLKAILSYIHTHYKEKITAEDIARHLGISRGECFRCFKAAMNKGLTEYIGEVRLEKAALLLPGSSQSITDISAECGFESPAYFGKRFKELYGISPKDYAKSHVWTENSAARIDGYDCELWRADGEGTMVIPDKEAKGAFSCRWHGDGNIIFRSGKRFWRRDKTHSELGELSLRYVASFQAAAHAYLCVYGWTVNPLVEWTIIEACTRPGINWMGNPLGRYASDEGEYSLYSNIQHDKPSIAGKADFHQHLSIRYTDRLQGVVDVSAHFRTWEAHGLPLGKLAELSLAVESLQGSGRASVCTNVITVNGGR